MEYVGARNQSWRTRGLAYPVHRHQHQTDYDRHRGQGRGVGVLQAGSNIRSARVGLGCRIRFSRHSRTTKVYYKLRYDMTSAHSSPLLLDTEWRRSTNPVGLETFVLPDYTFKHFIIAGTPSTTARLRCGYAIPRCRAVNFCWRIAGDSPVNGLPYSSRGPQSLAPAPREQTRYDDTSQGINKKHQRPSLTSVDRASSLYMLQPSRAYWRNWQTRRT